MKIKKLLVSLLITLTVLSTAVFAFGCGGTKGLVYELSDDETSYIVAGFGEEIEEYPEIIEIPAKYKGKAVTKIGTSAFKNITEIKTVILPEGLGHISASAFRGCENLEQINFPSTLKGLGAQAFHSCKKLPSIVIPEGMTEIPGSLLYGCESITEVTIPNGVTKVLEKAFGKTSIKKLTFPNSVTEIAKGAFKDADKLEEVIIGNGVKTLGSYLFDGCTALKKISFGMGLKVIESYAFNKCAALEEVVLPEGLRAIYGNAFFGCDAMKKLTLPGAVTTLCNNPNCGVTICPASKNLGFETHYHFTGWRVTEDSNPAYKHYHNILSHDLTDPEQAWKFFVTTEARSMHDYPNGVWKGDKWTYNEDNDVYKFDGKNVDGETDYDASIRSWSWDDCRGYLWYNGEKGQWYD
jgi:hypothetical protein